MILPKIRVLRTFGEAGLYVGRTKIWIEATSQYREGSERPLAKAPLATARGTDPVGALRNPDLGVPGI
jgi:hypothetical protein